MSKIYSCSMFFNELDLLELKLETLNDVVDYFVISESNMTHSGKPKPFYLETNLDRYKKFRHKIIHQKIFDTPSDYINLPFDTDGSHDKFYNIVLSRVQAGNWWDHHIESYGRDTFEKESLIRPLINLEMDDIVLLSDLDEIVRPETLKTTIENFNYDQIYHFQHDMFYYYLNLQKSEPWHGTIAVSFGKFLEKSFCEMRTHKTGELIPYGGWHFSFQGGKEAIKDKLEAYGEQSLNLSYIKENISFSVVWAMEIHRDLFGRPCTFTLRDVNDGTFPQYLVEHQNDIYKSYIYIY